MSKLIRLATGNKVKIIDKTSLYFGETGTLVEPRRVPVGMKLEYHWLVKIDGTGSTELLAPKQLEKVVKSD